MDKNSNPFVIIGYKSKSFFCDRENELEMLSNYVKNGIDITLISARRLGKTALLYADNLQHRLRRADEKHGY
ncbi:MAG: hypothetical protein LBE56_09760 [Tannerella sp.]|jgi:hypothetical protein|nr:hypothetical protein [Tannerella sp.]